MSTMSFTEDDPSSMLSLFDKVLTHDQQSLDFLKEIVMQRGSGYIYMKAKELEYSQTTEIYKEAMRVSINAYIDAFLEKHEDVKEKKQSDSGVRLYVAMGAILGCGWFLFRKILR